MNVSGGQRLIFFAILIPCLFLSACSSSKSPDQVCFKSQCVSVEIADNDLKRQRGLQNRDSLPENSGMLFIFSAKKIHSFWMKDTHIPLDMLWLDQNREIVYLAPNAVPCRQDPCESYTPLAPAMYVLELNAGKAEKMGLKVGEKVEFKLERYLGR